MGGRGGNSLEAIDGGGQSCLSFSPTRGRAALLLYFKDNQHRRLGVALRKRLGVRFADDGLRLELATNDGHRNCRRWRVVVDEQPDAPISGEAPGSSAGGPFVPGQTPLIADDLPDAVPRLVADDDGRRQYVLDLARELGFPALPFAPGRSVLAGEGAWVSFAKHAAVDDIHRVLEALAAHADAPAGGSR